jgi:hypothetical protein
MTTPSVSDLKHDGRPRTTSDWNNLLDRFEDWVTDGTYDFVINSITATTYNNLPGFNITGLVAGENIAAGDMVRLKVADGKAWRTDQSTVEGVTNILGAAVAAYSTGETVIVNNKQYTGYSSLTVGSRYYIATAGNISNTAGVVYKVSIGLATSTTTIEFDFSEQIKDFFNTGQRFINTSALDYNMTCVNPTNGANVSYRLEGKDGVGTDIIAYLRVDGNTGNAILSAQDGNVIIETITGTGIQVGTGGAGTEVFMPGVYNDDLSGATYRDLLVKDDGQLGYDSSTIRAKTNITDMEKTDWVYNLRPVNFNYRKKDKDGLYNDSYYDIKKYGLIAEEVEKIIPELVFYDQNGRVEGVQYREFMSILINVLQEHNNRINILENRGI